MAEEAKQFLAVNVLNEERTVSYRTLSRALKIHSNLAKQALFEFHKRQNARKAGSVHATYLLTGRRKQQQPIHTNGSHTQDTDGDSFMDSSQLLSSQPEPQVAEETIPVTTVLLVKEEDLEIARESFEELTSIHIYSLQPVSPQNIQALSHCNRDVLVKYRFEDPLEAWKQYGTIQNSEVRRRKLGVRPQDSMAKPAPTASAKAVPKPAPAAAVKEEKPAAAAAKPAPAEQKPKATSNAPALKKEKSDLFKSFAKAKPKKETKGSAADDNSMMMDDDDDDDDDDGNDIDIEISGPKEVSEEQRKAELEKQEQLRRMMDDDGEDTPKDVPMEDAAEEEPAVKEDDEEVQGAPLDKQDDPKEEKEATVTVSGGRRRGRRRVMKKKTVKDEDGYLVTKEEAEWESFSEEEPEAKKPKMAPVNAASKAKKGARPGQGNIMSFFKKG